MSTTWWKEAVAYQIYPRSFKDSNGDGIGDLKGITQKLDYVKDLGIDVIWICPMYKSPNDDNGYDISDYQAIMDEFGTMEDFDELLEEVHKRDMKLILDLVINHTSDEHPWFVESRSSKDNPKRDWYIWRDGKVNEHGEIAPPNNWESIFSGHAWKYDEETDQYFMHIFSTKQPDLNWENKEVREALFDMVNWWLDKGIDGFRVDAISHIKKKEGFPDMPNPHNEDVVSCFPYMCNVEGIDTFLSEFSQKTLKNYDIMTVGEANGVRLEEADKWVGEENGYFNMIFQFEHLGLWNKENTQQVDVVALKETLNKWQKGLEGKGWNALFLENHDQPRSVSSWGNESTYWKKSAKMLGAMYFLMQGTPFIYQGQELGMTNAGFDSIEDYNDVGMINFYHIQRQKGKSHEELIDILQKQCRDNSRTPMHWDSSKNGGFTTSPTTWIGMNPNFRDINVEQQLKDEDSILQFYKQMIRLRKENKVFVYGTFDLLLADHPELFVYTRTLENQQALVICNFSETENELTLPVEFTSESATVALSNYDIASNGTTVTLQPYETRVIIRQGK